MPDEPSCAAVLFDLDGTLLNSLDDLADATNRALAGLGAPMHELDQYRYFVGDGALMLITRALPEDRRDPPTIQHGLELFHQEYARNWHAKTRPYPGIQEMLDRLAQMGMKIAVLSNKPHEFTVECVKRFLANWKWNAVQGQTDQIPRKPSPAGAIEIARRLGLPVSRFVYLGDTATDMLTANAAGMLAVGVLWGFRQRDELEQAGARATLAHPAELPRLIQQRGDERLPVHPRH